MNKIDRHTKLSLLDLHSLTKKLNRSLFQRLGESINDSMITLQVWNLLNLTMKRLNLTYLRS